MPMPTCASCIMAISFAPSPIASVMLLLTLRLMERTSEAFCAGDARQQISESTRDARSVNNDLSIGDAST